MVMTKAEDTIVWMGGKVKAVGPNKVAGYLVMYGNPEETDLEGDFFTKETDFDAEDGHKITIYYHHGFDGTIKKTKLGKGVLKFTDLGVWVEAQLDAREDYVNAVMELVGREVLGWSSGTAPHLVEVEPIGKAYWIKAWPLGVDASLTPTPAEWRTRAVPIKTLREMTERFYLGTGAEASHKAANSAVDDAEPEALTPHPSPSGRGEQADGGEKKDSEELMEAKMADGNGTAPAPTAPAQVTVEAQAVKNALAEILGDVQGQIKQAVEVQVKAALDDPKIVTVPGGLGQKGGVEVGNVKRHTKAGFADEDMQAYARYLKRGDIPAAKAALQEDTDTEGGFLVPTPQLNRIIELRDELSIPRQLQGLMRFQMTQDKLDIPYETNTNDVLVRTAEEGTFDEKEPTFGNRQLIAHLFSRFLVMSVQLDMDEAVGLDGFITRWVARAIAKTENDNFINGDGTGDVQGILVGGALGTTFASNATIAAAEVPDMEGKIADFWLDGMVWIMRLSTLTKIQSLTGNPFLFVGMPQGNRRELWNHPVYLTDRMPAIATTAKSVASLNPERYAWGDRAGLSVLRNPYSLDTTGQVRFTWYFRFGGIVLNNDAVKYHAHPV